ncbi:uncharacterized protein N7500_009386 [Penicillium coprophilum]|uniref:uncharacterized protein n=1 Tax=Penicillium coprophilum TaxID=36646 RepID=UPI0023A13B4A|nr:uncharacterized protein N7500_009386 [Penicillium coprophilum]KAJ5153947.1 hypothetical protein N7500_009386 [Penicillium coprophilum]
MASRPNARNPYSSEPPGDTAMVVAQAVTERMADSTKETATEPTGDSIDSPTSNNTTNITANNHIGDTTINNTNDDTVTVINIGANPITIKSTVHITVNNTGNGVTPIGETITPVCSQASAFASGEATQPSVSNTGQASQPSNSSNGEATQCTVPNTGEASKLPDSSNAEVSKPSASNTRQASKFSDSSNEEATRHPTSSNWGINSETNYHQCDEIVSRTVNLHSPYVPETPDPALTQVWIDHIDHMLGVRTDHQTQDMQRCFEQTDRVVNLSNSIYAQATEMLEELRGINRGEYIHDDSGDDSSSTSGERRDFTEKCDAKKQI